MMSCREMVEFLDDYTADTLSADQRAVFEQHLDKCPPCVHYVESYQATIHLVKETADPQGASSTTAEVPKMPEQLVQAILAARKSSDP